jgi:hypothetical protein
MKMHLVVTAALAALSSHAAFARYDGGDTWSELEPSIGSVQPASSQQRDGLGAALARYDGGDTWSALEPTKSTYAGPIDSLTVATTAPLSTLRYQDHSVYGTPAQAPGADRIVRLGSDGQWINVAYGQTIDFVAEDSNGSEQSFAWRFNVSPDTSHVDLSDIAPADFPDKGVRVFVAEDPRYSGD